MLNFLPTILLIGIFLGVLAGLGVGGGSVLILWLTLLLHIDPTTAKGINLLFFLPAAIISCFFRWRQGRLHFQKVIPAMVAGALSAILFTWFSHQIPTEMLRKPFGVLLLFTGLKELFYRPRKAK